ncbi:uncharacterized protein [Brachionichthys hirsutus]|uniref:uncharacterized protein n=1 Tax=Brachionichthys hirsutus TaxID=412623 RepID=UPI003604EFD0
MANKSNFWDKGVYVGFTNVPPSSRSLPLPTAVCPFLIRSPGHWVYPLPEGFLHPDSEVHLSFNGRGVICIKQTEGNVTKEMPGLGKVDLCKPLWAIIDIFQRTTAVYLIGSKKQVGLYTKRSCPSDQREKMTRVEVEKFMSTPRVKGSQSTSGLAQEEETKRTVEVEKLLLTPDAGSQPTSDLGMGIPEGSNNQVGLSTNQSGLAQERETKRTVDVKKLLLTLHAKGSQRTSSLGMGIPEGSNNQVGLCTNQSGLAQERETKRTVEVETFLLTPEAGSQCTSDLGMGIPEGSNNQVGLSTNQSGLAQERETKRTVDVKKLMSTPDAGSQITSGLGLGIPEGGVTDCAKCMKRHAKVTLPCDLCISCSYKVLQELQSCPLCRTKISDDAFPTFSSLPKL